VEWQLHGVGYTVELHLKIVTNFWGVRYIAERQLRSVSYTGESPFGNVRYTGEPIDKQMKSTTALKETDPQPTFSDKKIISENDNLTMIGGHSDNLTSSWETPTQSLLAPQNLSFNNSKFF